MKRPQRVVEVDPGPEQLELALQPPTSVEDQLIFAVIEDRRFLAELEVTVRAMNQPTLFDWAEKQKVRRFMEHQAIIDWLARKLTQEGWSGDTIVIEAAESRGIEVTIWNEQIVVKSHGLMSVISMVPFEGRVMTYTEVEPGHIRSRLAP